MKEPKTVIKYQDSVTLTRKQATEILQSIWPSAPLNEVTKAALICSTYGLNPLMKHVFLIPFKNKKTGEKDWVVVLAKKATRIMAARKKAFSYIDDSPRIMTNGEPEKYFGENDPDKIYSITVLQDESGNVARGYGFWLRADDPYGADKGNSKANMAHLRSEGQAIDRMVPDTLPPDIDIIDERFVKELPAFDTETEVIEPPPSAQLQPSTCPIHGAVWEKKTGKRGTWFSHKTVEGWCNKSDVDKLSLPQQAQENVPEIAENVTRSPVEDTESIKAMPVGKVEYNRFANDAIGFFRQLDWKEKTIETWLRNNFQGCASLTDLKPDQWELCLSKLGDMLALKTA